MSVKPGEQTTEFKEAKSAGFWSILFAVLGVIVATGSTIVDALGGADTTAGVIAGSVVAIAGLAARTLTSLGYSASRAQVKAAAEQSKQA